MIPARPEFELLSAQGIRWDDPSEVVEVFERSVAEFCGARYAVAVDCATHAMELSLRYLEARGEIRVPCHTYPSVPMTVLQLGGRLSWTEERWEGAYTLDPYPVVDSALRFSPGCYQPGSFTCLSFQHKKRIGIGRGGMILLDDGRAHRWLKMACHDGRQPGLRWHHDAISMLGWHYYMTPEDAARGLLLLRSLGNDLADLGGWRNYPDLRTLPVFRRPLAEAPLVT
jgi:dTDP-4-amino-4,6-dideoxygalactose transaminase